MMALMICLIWAKNSVKKEITNGAQAQSLVGNEFICRKTIMQLHHLNIICSQICSFTKKNNKKINLEEVLFWCYSWEKTNIYFLN